MMKAEVRALAEDLDLPVAKKHESYEICFVPSGDYAAFMDAWLKEKGVPAEATAGVVVDTQGHERGRHAGAHHFTVGQRKGLGISAAEPLYVIATDSKTQTVTIGSNDDLLRSTMTARDVNWVSWNGLAAPARAQVRIRNRHTPAAATIYPLDAYPLQTGRVEVRFDEPQRAVTPGQGAVFYSGDLVAGGGWIE
jgi:tRNA-specific 2-thiouridylase